MDMGLFPKLPFCKTCRQASERFGLGCYNCYLHDRGHKRWKFTESGLVCLVERRNAPPRLVRPCSSTKVGRDKQVARSQRGPRVQRPRRSSRPQPRRSKSTPENLLSPGQHLLKQELDEIAKDWALPPPALTPTTWNVPARPRCANWEGYVPWEAHKLRATSPTRLTDFSVEDEGPPPPPCWANYDSEPDDRCSSHQTTSGVPDDAGLPDLPSDSDTDDDAVWDAMLARRTFQLLSAVHDTDEVARDGIGTFQILGDVPGGQRNKPRRQRSSRRELQTAGSHTAQQREEQIQGKVLIM